MIFCVLTVQISSTSQAAVRAKDFFHFFDWDAGCPIFSRNTLLSTRLHQQSKVAPKALLWIRIILIIRNYLVQVRNKTYDRFLANREIGA